MAKSTVPKKLKKRVASGASTERATKQSRPRSQSRVVKRPKGAQAIRLLQLPIRGGVIEAPFEPYDIKKSGAKNGSKLTLLPGELPFYSALRMAQSDPSLGQSELWGLLPNDFSRRTQLSGLDLLSIISKNPGYDFYYCSANPELEALYHNAWRAPAVTHPDFIEISRAFLRAAGIGDGPIEATSHSTLFATGNLIVASPKVWKQYITFADRAISVAAEAMDRNSVSRLYGEKQQSGRMTHLALIVARLPGVFLMLKEANFRAFKIALPEQEKALNPHLRALREMKDFGLEQRSRWHLNSWLLYRGLYLSHVMGKAWVLQHIERVTPRTAITAVPTASVTSDYALKADAAL